jgi:hypothetical protein
MLLMNILLYYSKNAVKYQLKALDMSVKWSAPVFIVKLCPCSKVSAFNLSTEDFPQIWINMNCPY